MIQYEYTYAFITNEEKWDERKVPVILSRMGAEGWHFTGAIEDTMSGSLYLMARQVDVSGADTPKPVLDVTPSEDDEKYEIFPKFRMVLVDWFGSISDRRVSSILLSMKDAGLEVGLRK